MGGLSNTSIISSTSMSEKSSVNTISTSGSNAASICRPTTSSRRIGVGDTKGATGLLPLLEASDAGEALVLSFAGGWTVATSAEPAMFTSDSHGMVSGVMRASIEWNIWLTKPDTEREGEMVLDESLACTDGAGRMRRRGSDMCGDGGRRKKKEEGEVAR